MALNKNPRLVTLDSAQFVEVNELYPDSRYTPVGPTDGNLAISKKWTLMQGTLREGAAVAMLVRWDRSLSAAQQFDKKHVWYDTSDGCSMVFTPVYISDGCTSTYIAVQVAAAGFEPSTVTWNTKPNLATVDQRWASTMLAGTEVTCRPQGFADIGATENLRQAINNGMCFMVMANDARPKDSTATLFESTFQLKLSSIQMTVRVADIKLEPANLSPAAGAYTAPDAAVVLSWTVPEPEYYFNTAPVQASFAVQYYTVKGGVTSATKTITGTTETTVTIPSVDMTGAEAVSWRVKVTSDDGSEPGRSEHYRGRDGRLLMGTQLCFRTGAGGRTDPDEARRRRGLHGRLYRLDHGKAGGGRAARKRDGDCGTGGVARKDARRSRRMVTVV